ncbi:MAG: LysR family transcriptional regulator [Myxococcales bacterium]|nr:LysR family transcriptional regulator [Myxococcales bacterium]
MTQSANSSASNAKHPDGESRPGLDAIAVFAAVVTAGSLSAAARAQGLSKATLSRAVTALERDLGTTLVERRASGLVPTTAGRALLERALPALAELERAREQVRRASTVTAGRIRVSSPPELASVWVGPAVQSFLREHNDVDVELQFGARLVDLAREGFDVVVRGGRVDDPAVRMRVLGRMRAVLVASRAYLTRAGPPQSPEALASHSCLTLAVDQGRAWDVVDAAGRAHRVVVSGRLVSNDLLSLRDAAIAGLGIARLPEALCAEALARGELERVLDRCTLAARMYYVVTPGGRLPARVRAFVEHLVRTSGDARSAGSLLSKREPRRR